MQSFGIFYILLTLPAIHDSLERIVVVPEDVLQFQLDLSFDLDMKDDSFSSFNLLKHLIDCHPIYLFYLAEIPLQR